MTGQPAASFDQIKDYLKDLLKKNGAMLAIKCKPCEMCSQVVLAALHTYKTLSGFTPLGNFTGVLAPKLK